MPLPGGKLEWNVPYLKSIPGVLGVAEVVSYDIFLRLSYFYNIICTTHIRYESSNILLHLGA